MQKLKVQYEKIYGFYKEMFVRCVLDSYKKKFKCLMVMGLCKIVIEINFS